MNSKDVKCFAFCCDDNYAKYAMVCIQSILNTNRKSFNHIFLISDYISEDNITLFNKITEGVTNSKIEIIIIDDSSISKLPIYRWTKYAWYRILIPNLLPKHIEKVLYLDCDTLVLDDLYYLFNFGMDGIAVGGVLDPQTSSNDTFSRCKYDFEKGYICSGVLMMNLNYWRGSSLSEKIIEYAIENEDNIEFPDQDCINILCQDIKALFPLKYGFMDVFVENEFFCKNELKVQLIEALATPAIVHYAGCVPWIRESRPSIFSAEWDSVNSTLEKPVKLKFQAKGIHFVNRILWNLTHPRYSRMKYSRQKALDKLKNSNSRANMQ